MNPPAPRFKDWHDKYGPVACLIAAALALVAYLTLRDRGVYPVTMWDEWEYNRYARQLPLAAADVPYYLYYYVYGLTKIGGSAFMTCACFLNALFLAASLPFLYLVGRRTAPPFAAAAIAAASVFGAISAFASHFMPESMYFFGFWLCAWALLSAIDAQIAAWKIGIGSGAALALLSLVKLHALFLLPGLALFFTFCAATGQVKGGKERFLAPIAALLASFFALRLSLGYAIAGTNGLALAGTTYGGSASSALAAPAFLPHALPYLAGHVLALLAMYAVPMLLIATIDFKATPGTHQQKLRILQAFALTLLLPLLAVVVLYTAHVSLLNPAIEGGGGLLRLHQRYYDFLFPLFTLMAASVAFGPVTEPQNTSIKRLAAALASLAVLFFITHLDVYEFSMGDGPELRGFATLRPVAYGLAAAAILSAMLWTVNARRAARFYLFLIFPLLTLLGGAAAFYSAHKAKTPTLYHRAGLFARVTLQTDIDKLAVVGPDYPGVYQAMIEADDHAIAFYNNIPANSCLKLTPAATGKEWILLTADYKILSPIDKTVEGQGYRLIHSQPAQIETADCP